MSNKKMEADGPEVAGSATRASYVMARIDIVGEASAQLPGGRQHARLI